MRYVIPEEHCRKRLRGREFPEWQTAVLCFRGIGGSSDLLSLLSAKPIDYRAFWGVGGVDGNAPAYEATVHGSLLVIIPNCIWGATQAAILVEELACYGCKNVIGYGCIGSLDQSVDLLHQVAVEDAMATDGTSRCYGVSELAADRRLLSLAHNAAGCVGTDILSVRAATVDAPYRETPELVEAWRSLGVQAINMEVSALYAAAQTCEMSSIWIGFVSDRLGKTWELPSSGKTEASEVSAHLCQKLLELLI